MVDRSSLTDEVRLADLTFEGALDRLVVYTAMEDGQLALNCERVVVAEIEALRFFCALLMACAGRASDVHSRLLEGVSGIKVGKPMPYFCPACQAIPRDGYCKLAGCPTAPLHTDGGRG